MNFQATKHQAEEHVIVPIRWGNLQAEKKADQVSGPKHVLYDWNE
jgi:hypothetical protein